MKVAIIGLGGISAVHSKVLMEQGHQIVAVCDVDESRFSAFPQSKHFTDYRQMLEEVAVDGVHICTPHYLHAEMVVECLRRNVNTLCEKPLCISMEEAQRILDAERRSSAILGVVHQNRYNAVSRVAKEFFKENPPITGFATVAWCRGVEYYRSAEWRGRYATEGGGVLINQALHTLDLMQWFLGMPQKVSAVTASLKLQGVIEVEDTVCASFTGEKDFQMFATNCASVDFPVAITVQTEKDVVRLYSNQISINGKLLECGAGQAIESSGTEGEAENKIYGKKCYGEGHSGLIADFYDCIEKGEKFSIDGAEGLAVIRLIETVYQSGGKCIEILK